MTLNLASTSASLAQELCPLLDDTTTLVSISATDASILVDLPECLFQQATAPTSLTLYNVAIYGNTSIPDPLSRFPPSVISLGLYYVRLVAYQSTSTAQINGQYVFEPDWTSFVSRLPALSSFTCQHCGLRTPPTSLASSTNLIDLSNNVMTGPIPSTMLSNFDASLTTLHLSLDGNQLTGTIPSSLFDKLTTMTVLLFTAPNNYLVGPLPSNLFSSMTVTSSFSIDLSGNKIGGSIPVGFLNGQLIAPSVSVSLTGNQLTGSIPSDLVTGAHTNNARFLSIHLNSNQLSGTISSALLSYSGGCNVINVAIDLSDNKLSGLVPNLFSEVQCTAITNFNFRAAQNSLSGGVPPGLLRSGATSNLLSVTIDLSSNNLTDPLASDLLTGQQIPTLSLTLDYNQMTGSPFDFVLNMANLQNISSISITASHNRFTGSVPASLFSNWTNATSSPSSAPYFTLDVSNNGIEGALPSGVFGSMTFSNSAFTIWLNLANNSLTGAYPPSLFRPVLGSSALSSLRFTLDGNAISLLPDNLWAGDTLPSNLVHFALILSSNALSTLPVNLMTSVPSQLGTFTIQLDNNRLGSIPNGFLPVSASDGFGLSLSMINCSLSGRLPSVLFNSSLGGNPVSLAFDQNNLFGAINLSSLVPSSTQSSSPALTFSASNNLFNESLIIGTSSPQTALTISVSNNRLSSLSFGTNGASALQSLDISNNPSLTGTLPSSLFTDSSALIVSLMASKTALSGPMPSSSLSGPTLLETLELSGTKIDFCALANPFGASLMTDCNLLSTSASSTCPSLYPAICFPGVTCDNKTKPSDDFTCIGGVWTSTGSVTAPVLTIPSGASQTVITGSIGSSSVVFGSIGSTLTISGCANNLTSVTLVLSSQDLNKLNSKTIQQLIYYNGSDPSCNDLSNVTVVLKTTGSSCRRAMATKATSSGTLSALFTVNTSRCNTWWIILVSVICGVIVILVIIFALLVLLVPSVRHFVRPYSKPRVAIRQ